jgi:hypothetical protein
MLQRPKESRSRGPDLHQLRHAADARDTLGRVRTMLAASQGQRRLTADPLLKALYDEALTLIAIEQREGHRTGTLKAQHRRASSRVRALL